MLRFKEKRVVLFEPMCNEGHLHDFMYNPVLVNFSGKYTHIYIYKQIIYIHIPVVPHKAVAEVSKRGKL